MRTEPEVARIVRSWLEDGVDRAPERILDATLERVPTTPQHRPMWPARRLPQMPIFVRLAAATAAVIVVALGATMLLPDLGGVGVPTPSPTVLPSPSAPAPSAGGTLGTADIGRSLTPGTYQVGDPYGAPLSVTMPFGWMVRDIAAGNAAFNRPLREDPAVWRAELDIGLVTNVFADPCLDDAPLTPPVAMTVDDVVAALTGMAGITATDPTDVEIGGRATQAFEISYATSLATAGCVDDGQLRLMTVRGDGADDTVTTTGSRLLVWVLDVDGQVVVILGEPISHPEQPLASSEAEARATIQQIVGSIDFD